MSYCYLLHTFPEITERLNWNNFHCYSHRFQKESIRINGFENDFEGDN